MNTRYGMAFGLVGLLISTVAFAAAPAASEVAEEVVAASLDARHSNIEEVIVVARHPDAEAKGDELAVYNPRELLNETPIHAPSFADPLLVKPELRLTL